MSPMADEGALCHGKEEKEKREEEKGLPRAPMTSSMRIKGEHSDGFRKQNSDDPRRWLPIS